MKKIISHELFTFSLFKKHEELRTEHAQNYLKNKIKVQASLYQKRLKVIQLA